MEEQADIKKPTLDVIEQLEDELEIDITNYKTWIKLIDKVLEKDNEEKIRDVYTRFLKIFKLDVSNMLRISFYKI